MAEEEDKKNQQTDPTKPVKKQGGSSKTKRRRRPRKKKKPNVQADSDAATKVAESKKKRRRRPKKRKPKQEEKADIASQITVEPAEETPVEEPSVEEPPVEEPPADKDIFAIDEEVTPEEKMEDDILGEEKEEAVVEEGFPVLEEETQGTEEKFPTEEPEIETEIETGEAEEQFLASDEGAEPTDEESPVDEEAETPPEEPQEVEPPPELPDEISPAQPTSEPPKAGDESEFAMKEEPQGPVGWDQLKNAIKKDHEVTEQKMDAGITPVPAPVPVAEKPETEEPEAVPVPTPTPEPEPAPTPEPVPEVEPVPVVEQPVDELAADDDAEKKEIIKIIIKYAVGGCAVIAIIAGIFLFRIPQTIWEFSQDLLDSGETKQIDQVDEPVTDTTPEPQEETPKSDSDIKDGTGIALISGDQIPKVKKVPESVQTLFKIGLPEVQTSETDRIATYMQVLNELQNGFETDINQLLDASNNRASAISIHLRELNGLLAEAQFTYENLREEADEIKVQYNKVTNQKDILEEAFFVSLEKLESSESNEILNDFVEVSKSQINLKAEHSALSKIGGMYDTAISNMEARIKDIEANKEALVKGVKVVDIKGSDLNLIIEEGEL